MIKLNTGMGAETGSENPLVISRVVQNVLSLPAGEQSCWLNSNRS